MTAITERIPVDEISRQAHAARPGRVALALVTGILWGFGWLIAKTLGTLFLGLMWVLSAVKVGWMEGTGQHARPSRGQLAEDNMRMAAELETLRAQARG